MKALSIRGLGAWLIIHGGKDTENRTWRTSYRGEFYVHVSGSIRQGEYSETYEFARLFAGLGMRLPAKNELKLGGIIGKVELVDCVKHSDSPWYMGDYGFVLRNPQPMDFIPCKGALGFFTPKI